MTLRPITVLITASGAPGTAALLRRLSDNGERGIAPARHDVERVAIVAADRLRRHVSTDESDRALAVQTQRAQECRRSRRTRRRHDHR